MNERDIRQAALAGDELEQRMQPLIHDAIAILREHGIQVDT